MHTCMLVYPSEYQFTAEMSEWTLNGFKDSLLFKYSQKCVHFNWAMWVWRWEFLKMLNDLNLSFSALSEVQKRQCLLPQCMCKGTQSSGWKKYKETPWQDTVCNQHSTILLRGTSFWFVLLSWLALTVGARCSCLEFAGFFSRQLYYWSISTLL